MKSLILYLALLSTFSSYAAYNCVFLDYGVTVQEGSNALVEDSNCESGQMLLMCGCYGESDMACVTSMASLDDAQPICQGNGDDKDDIDDESFKEDSNNESPARSSGNEHEFYLTKKRTG